MADDPDGRECYRIQTDGTLSNTEASLGEYERALADPNVCPHFENTPLQRTAHRSGCLGAGALLLAGYQFLCLLQSPTVVAEHVVGLIVFGLLAAYGMTRASRLMTAQIRLPYYDPDTTKLEALKRLLAALKRRSDVRTLAVSLDLRPYTRAGQVELKSSDRQDIVHDDTDAVHTGYEQHFTHAWWTVDLGLAGGVTVSLRVKRSVDRSDLPVRRPAWHPMVTFNQRLCRIRTLCEVADTMLVVLERCTRRPTLVLPPRWRRCNRFTGRSS
ncbi:MAG TPA: hypothetical protein VGO93_21415 [Candidatus Xenobia bacterium]|jgi:hypothetical protein